jgi:hypothetical protein
VLSLLVEYTRCGRTDRRLLSWPGNAFFVIDASRGPVVRTEILHESTRTQEVPEAEQLGLFD